MQITGVATALSISQPCWLSAHTCNVIGHTIVSVYRSVLVRDSDSMFAPVKTYLDDNGFHVVREGVFVDANVMFGRGRLSAHVAGADSQYCAAELFNQIRDGLGLTHEVVG